MKYFSACIAWLLLAMMGCSSDRESLEGGDEGSERLVTQIIGKEFYDGYDGILEASSIDKFYYDDEDRLVRWVSENSSESYVSSFETELFYESPDHIYMIGTGSDDSFVAEIDLESNRAVKVILSESNYSNPDASFSHEYELSYSNGKLVQVTFSDQSVSGPVTRQMACTWERGDWTRLTLTPSPYTDQSTYEERCQYGTKISQTNIDVNFLAYGTEFFSAFLNATGRMLGLAGFFGRNSHLVEQCRLSGDTSNTRVTWEFDEEGYPTGWESRFSDSQYPETNSGWRYTIQYNK